MDRGQPLPLQKANWHAAAVQGWPIPAAKGDHHNGVRATPRKRRHLPTGTLFLLTKRPEGPSRALGEGTAFLDGPRSCCEVAGMKHQPWPDQKWPQTLPEAHQRCVPHSGRPDTANAPHAAPTQQDGTVRQTTRPLQRIAARPRPKTKKGGTRPPFPIFRI